jgi:hypothetical protein
MNTTQTIAWLICLLLAFFATILAVRASYQSTVMERRFEEVQQAAGEQQKLLSQIRDVLQRMEERMGGGQPAAEAPKPAAATAASSRAAQPSSE